MVDWMVAAWNKLAMLALKEKKTEIFKKQNQP